ncbi:MAG TPA: hypothetical protein EYQ14_06965 [Gammaproteobacteria bacterium]|nr:hypothetical protein [Gammaproteobacteria bacterium]
MSDLIKDGCQLFPSVVPENLLNALRTTTDELCRHKDAKRSQGIMLSTMADPLLAELITLPAALLCLQTFGYSNPTFTDGYIISKPPQSPRLFWHYDWFAWKDPDARSPVPQQVFFMYYLVDTTPVNGCLRVIPGSHRQHNPLHDQLGSPHSAALSRIDNPDDAAFSTRPDEIDLPVCAGDLLIGDARLLHAAHANTSESLRTVITLWYQPCFDQLPERVKAQMVRKTQPTPEDWPKEARRMVKAMQPTYDGDAEPYSRDLYQEA